MAKNIIFYGPPGTGKTYYMQSLMGDYMDFAIEDDHIRNVYETRLTEDWFLIGLILLQRNEPMTAAEISEKISDLNIGRAITPTDILEAYSVADSPIGAQRLVPRIFEQYGQKWYVSRMDLLEYDKDFFVKYVETESISKRYYFITFHQSYSYEDFIEGIRPSYVEEANSLDYSPKDGVFKMICKTAAAHPEKEYALFIDEINRGNISEIFGELISLIETNKRKNEPCELETVLPYSKETFSVPNNLNIYGTMNSADKSIAAIDLALRRRFEFVPFSSSADIIRTELGRKGIDASDVDGINVIRLFNTINARITLLLDEDHVIGHSYFLDISTLNDIANVIRFQIIPTLEEYFFDDPQKIQFVFSDLDENGELKETAVYLSTSLNPEDYFSYFGDYDLEPQMRFSVSDNITADSIIKIYS